jgi:hypothetical protein
MKKLLSILLASFALQIGTAQVLSPTIVNSNGINYQNLAYVDSVLNEHISNNWMVGAVVIVVKDNKVVYYKGHTWVCGCGE